MDNLLKNRLLEFIAFKKINNSDFEKICGLSNGFVYNCSPKTRMLSLNRISAKFPELNIDWLRTGEGEMLNKNVQYLIADSEFHHSPVQQGINNINNDFVAGLLETINKKDEQINKKDEQIKKRDEQIDRLLSMLELT